MKNIIVSSTILASLTGAALAGPVMPSPEPDAFSSAIAPISNPTLSLNPLPQTNIHAVYMYHSLPDSVSVDGGSVDLNGDVNIFAVQFEYAFNERFSLVAAKDGYIDFNPDNTLEEESGFANLAAGVKYAFIYNEQCQHVLSGTAIVELPTGNRDVFQGYGDGAVNLILSGLKLHDNWQFSGSAGAKLPFDGDEESVTGFASAHVSYRVTERFIPLLEVNWFHVMSEGEGEGAALGQLLEFDGLDLINFGSKHGGRNRDTVTAAAGFRYRMSDCLDLGAAYEMPLTDDSDGLTDSRLTLDLVWRF